MELFELSLENNQLVLTDEDTAYFEARCEFFSWQSLCADAPGYLIT